MGVRIRDNNKIPQALKNIREINQRKVGVGYITGGDYDNGKITAKGLARVHEFGVDIKVTPKMRAFFIYKFGIGLKASTTHIRIPERSFLRNGADEATNDVLHKCKQLIGRVILGNVTVREFYEELGNTMAEEIKRYAIELDSPSNAPLTVENKGFDDPLVETGNMINSIEVIVK